MAEVAQTRDRALRIANCSGFYGDRLSAMREVLQGPVDVVSGDYLAELTLLILGRDQLRDPSLGYARTFVRQVEGVLGEVLERGIRIVANAGGLNPDGLASRLREVASGLGLDPVIAHVEGDNLAPRAAELGFEGALTANAYLGGFGIARGLAEGADIVVTGRVTDASVVVGPAAWWHGWLPTSYDALAGAVVAGHVIECGTQATGGNFSGFRSLPRDAVPLGFPVAEVASDGSSVITKQDGTGGLVSVDTVTAQLMYEIQSTTYLNPDVSVDLASVRLRQDGPDRVVVEGVRGGPPPERLKVCVNTLGGHRNHVELVLVGLDLDEKAAWVRAQLEARLSPRPAVVEWSASPWPTADADTEEGAARLLRCTVKDSSAEVVGRAFSSAAVELALASYPGFTMTAPPGSGSPYGVYRAEYVDRAEVTETVHVGDQAWSIDPPVEVVATGSPSTSSGTPSTGSGAVAAEGPSTGSGTPSTGSGTGGHPRVPFGSFVHARSGDKGGDANIGLWVRADPADRRSARVGWLVATVTPEWVHRLLPETRELDVEVFTLPDLGGVNVLVHGLLGDGVAASTRFDPQAKAVGEWLRSRHVEIPEELL